MTLAQTYPQLAMQLAEAGWRSTDLTRVRRAHELAASLFSTAQRGSGKPFVDHLVGTASGVLLGGGEPEVVAAALLHAAYDQGDFGDGRTGPTPKHRRRVFAAVGEEAEHLVHGYHQLGWSRDIAVSALTAVDSLDREGRAVLLMRLANEVDDATDGGLILSRKDSLPQHRRNVHDIAVQLSERIATCEFTALCDTELLGDRPHVPQELIVGTVASTTRIPESYRRRVLPTVQQSMPHIRHHMGRAARRVQRRLRRRAAGRTDD